MCGEKGPCFATGISSICGEQGFGQRVCGEYRVNMHVLALGNPQPHGTNGSFLGVTVEHPCCRGLCSVREGPGRASWEARESLLWVGTARQSYTGALGKEPRPPTQNHSLASCWYSCYSTSLSLCLLICETRVTIPTLQRLKWSVECNVPKSCKTCGRCSANHTCPLCEYKCIWQDRCGTAGQQRGGTWRRRPWPPQAIAWAPCRQWELWSLVVFLYPTLALWPSET